MTEPQVKSAISKDFKLGPDKIKDEENLAERTRALSIVVSDLLEGAGAAKVAYIFGYSTKKLIQVNVLWGTAIAGALTLAGDVTVDGTNGTVNLTSAGAIDQTGGAIIAGAVTGSSVGGTDLDGANQVGVFSGFTNTGSGDVGLINARALAAGSLTNTAGNLTLTTTTGDLALLGDLTVNAASGTVTLTSAAGITQPLGKITAGSLAVTAAASADLPGSNLVNTLAANVTGSGNSFDFLNAQTLTVGTVGALSGVTTNGTAGTEANIVLQTTAGDILITQRISTNGANGNALGLSLGEIGLSSAGKITLSGASANLVAFALEAVAADTVSLDASANAAGNRLGGSDSGGVATNGGTISGQVTGSGDFKFVNQNAPLLVDQVSTGAGVGVAAGSLSLPLLTGVTTGGGNLTLVTAGAGGVAINQGLNAGTGLVTVAATGDLAIGAGGSVAGGSATLATLGNFSNSAGAAAITVGAGGRWLVYSTDPALDNDGGLTPDFLQYN
ncbi:MAG TPA: hypothetical protein VFE12_16370, partial [Acetobacteraceae bacterium]|nr:hypothetical protein [Acetobacteraceae bacterium]